MHWLNKNIFKMKRPQKPTANRNKQIIMNSERPASLFALPDSSLFLAPCGRVCRAEQDLDWDLRQTCWGVVGIFSGKMSLINLQIGPYWIIQIQGYKEKLWLHRIEFILLNWISNLPSSLFHCLWLSFKIRIAPRFLCDNRPFAFAGSLRKR